MLLSGASAYGVGLYDTMKKISRYQKYEISNDIIAGKSLDTVVEEKRIIPEKEMNWKIGEIHNKYGNDIGLYFNSNFFIRNDNGVYMMNKEGNIEFYTRNADDNAKDALPEWKGNWSKECTFIIDEYLDEDYISVHTDIDGEKEKGLIIFEHKRDKYTDDCCIFLYSPEGSLNYNELISTGHVGNYDHDADGYIRYPMYIEKTY